MASGISTHVNVGDVLVGKFRVERVLGIGGMGMVLAAMHVELEQRVAIKMMLPDVMRSAHHVERFLREAKSAVKLRSEHVCRVLDVGKLEDGTPFIVMEFMDGQNFGELLDTKGPLKVADAVEYVMQAIEGVAEAHANRIVHRDLKPQNLFVTTDGDGSPLVKVLDFGISKSTVVGGATKTGEIMGSPSYMAPEQMMSAKDVDGRADVWALGVILYQAVTGRLPFEGESLPVLCMSVLHDQPPAPTALRTDLPPAFGAVIMRCLAKELPQRFPNVGALAKALAPFGRGDATSTAERVSKMLHRASSPVIGATDANAAITTAPAMPHGAISTLQASAGAMEAFREPPARRRGLLLALGAALTTIAVIAGAVVFAGGDRDTRRPSAAPATATPAPPVPAAQPPAPSPVPAAPAPAPPSVSGPAEPPAAVTVPPPTPVRTTAPVTSPKPARTSTSTTKPTRAKPVTPAPTPKPSCDPPYTVDAAGKRTYKTECL